MGNEFDTFGSYETPRLRPYGSDYHSRHQGPRTDLGRTVALGVAIAGVVLIVALIVSGHLAK